MTAPESPADGLAAVAATGDVRATLETARDDLAKRLEACGSDRDYAALMTRLESVLDRLAALPTPTAGTALDELANRRKAAGRPDASRRTRASGGANRG